jgi:hypothetical protein
VRKHDERACQLGETFFPENLLYPIHKPSFILKDQHLHIAAKNYTVYDK